MFDRGQGDFMMCKRIGLFLWSAIILTTVLLAGCSGVHPKKAHDSRRYIREYSLENLPRFDVPVEMNDRVVAWMEYFQGPGRGHFRRYLERSGRYIPLMQEILKKEGMPKDLVYVALIESGFNTQARSIASAVGPWQFIQSTGRRYNLRIDGWVDERRDPYKATHAAAQYLKDLYAEFGDWYLAMAGYNAGEGRIRQAIAATGSNNFWALADDRRALRPETRDYVPKFIAAAIMAKMPEKFGFDQIDYREPFDYDKGVVETQTDLSVIAKCSGTSKDDIFDLNPHLIRGATPPGMTDYEIRLPRGKGGMFAEEYAKLPEDDRISIARHTVQRGETLARIAKRYGVSAGALAMANNLNPKRYHLKRGMTLVIPKGSQMERYADIAGNSDGSKSSSKKLASNHTVRRGETLGGIAKRYGMNLKQLVALNGIKDHKKIRAGMKLKIQNSSAVAKNETESAEKKSEAALNAGSSEKIFTEHKISKGDTIQTIARRYGVAPSQLLAMNDIRNPKNLRPGTKLVIRKGAPVSKPSAVVKVADATAIPLPQTETPETPASVPSEPLSANQSRISSSSKEILMTEASQSQSLSDKMGEDFFKSGSTEVTSAKLIQSAETKTAPEADEHVPVKLSDAKKPAAKTMAQNGPAKANAPSGPAISYRVKNGDTLWDIARRHKVTIAEIQKWNNLKDPSAVKPGVTLKIEK